MPAVFFKNLPSLVVLFEVFFRPPFLLNPILDGISLAISDVICRQLAKCVYNRNASKECSQLFLNKLEWRRLVFGFPRSFSFSILSLHSFSISLQRGGQVLWKLSHS
jgi:hypothetical protein